MFLPESENEWGCPQPVSFPEFITLLSTGPPISTWVPDEPLKRQTVKRELKLFPLPEGLLFQSVNPYRIYSNLPAFLHLLYYRLSPNHSISHLQEAPVSTLAPYNLLDSQLFLMSVGLKSALLTLASQALK